MNQPLHVIAVEDSNDDAFLLRRQLERAGYDVMLERVDTEAALVSALNRQHWDVVFSDFSMPSFDGISALKVVRAHDRDVPFIIVSGTIGEERAVQLMKTGAQDYVIKGNINRLIPAVEREIKEAKLRREHRFAQEHIERLAYYSSLTQLPNRHRLLEDLRRHLEQSTSVALLVIRLFNFREVNEILGYSNGDQILRDVAGRLGEVFSGSLYHSQGNEFAVICAGEDRSKIEAVAQAVRQVLGPPYPIAGLRVRVRACIGIALASEDSKDPLVLIQNADSAATLAKREQAPFLWHEPTRDSTRASQLALVADLHDAFGTEQLSLVFQPKVARQTGVLTGSEALLRWRHPKEGMIPPDVFVAMAERYGLIDQLTRHVVACIVRHTQGSRHALPVSINLSATNLLDLSLMSEILQVESRDADSRRRIEIEITETALMQDPERALRALRSLHQAGIRIYIDDFGTGFSSLGYLSKLPIDAIKIDKSFVIDLLHKPECDTIVRSTIGLAHNLGLAVVAEGVEDQATWERLKSYECDQGQGYYFAKPLPPDQFDEWVVANKKF